MKLSDFSKILIIPTASEIKDKVCSNALKLRFERTQVKLEEIIKALHAANRYDISVSISLQYVDIDFIKDLLKSKGYEVTVSRLKDEFIMNIYF